MSSSNGNGLDRKNSMPPHSVATTRRARDERQPSIKDINELYSALQDLVNLSPGRGARGSDDPKTSPRSREVSPLSREALPCSRDVPPSGPASDSTNTVQLNKTKVARAVSSPSSSPRLRNKCATLPTKAKIAAFAALMEAAEKSRDEFEKGESKSSPGLLHKHGKVAPLGNAAGLDLAIAMSKDKIQDTENSRTPKPPCRQRSRSTPGISKTTAMRKLKEKQRKITESFSKKEKVEGPTVIRSIDDLMELAKQTSGTKTKTSPFSGRRSTKRLSGSRETSRRHTTDPFLTPDLVTSRLDDWYQKAVAKAVNDTDFEDENGHLCAESGSRKASDSSLTSLNSVSSLNSYNSACTDFSTTEDHDLVTSECRRFTEQLRNLDIGKDGEDYDSDNDSGVNVKPTFIFVRESKDKLPPHVVKALSESHLNVKYGEKEPTSHGSGHDIRTSTPDGKPSKPYFYIPNLTDDQKTSFTLVVDCEGKDENADSSEQRVVGSDKIGLAQDSNFYNLQDGACQVIHRVGLSPKVRPKSYDIAESNVDVSDLLEVHDEDRRKMGRTKSLYVGKEIDKKDPCRYNRNNVTIDDNDNILGITEKKWWEVFKPRPQGEVPTGRKKTKRKSSFKRN